MVWIKGPALLQPWRRVGCSCGLHSSLAWERPYATGAAQQKERILI